MVTIIRIDEDDIDTSDLKDIYKLIYKLSNEGIIASMAPTGWFIGLSTPLIVISKEQQKIYIYIKDKDDEFLSNHEKAAILAEELRSCGFDAESNENCIGIKYEKDTSDEKHQYTKKIKDILSDWYE